MRVSSVLLSLIMAALGAGTVSAEANAVEGGSSSCLSLARGRNGSLAGSQHLPADFPARCALDCAAVNAGRFIGKEGKPVGNGPELEYAQYFLRGQASNTSDAADVSECRFRPMDGPRFQNCTIRVDRGLHTYSYIHHRPPTQYQPSA